jgi:phosphoribosylglycinamide formyltransferase-1
VVVLRIGFLASHGGSAMRAVVEAMRAGTLAGEPVVVISNNSDAPALAYARAAGIAAVHLSAATHRQPEALDAAIADTLARHGAEVVLLSGYMKKVGPRVLERFRGRILNTHPALLPRFGGQGMYGEAVHRAVLAAGERVTGATVHLVDGLYDHGPVLRQQQVPVLPGDTAQTLQERVKAAEGPLVVQVLRDIASGRLRL